MMDLDASGIATWDLASGSYRQDISPFLSEAIYYDLDVREALEESVSPAAGLFAPPLLDLPPRPGFGSTFTSAVARFVAVGRSVGAAVAAVARRARARRVRRAARRVVRAGATSRGSPDPSRPRPRSFTAAAPLSGAARAALGLVAGAGA
jgi:hypothetical protein